MHTTLFADVPGFALRGLTSRALAEGARLIESPGDAVLVWAPTAAAAMKTAMLLRHALHAEPSWPAPRAGLHGQCGDTFEATAQLAARVAAHARPGQILCTRPVVRALRATEFVFRPLVAARLEPAHEPHDLFELVDGAPSTLVEIDPVCGLRLDPLKALHHLPFEGRTWFFCSRSCAGAFTAQRRKATTTGSPPRQPSRGYASSARFF